MMLKVFMTDSHALSKLKKKKTTRGEGWPRQSDFAHLSQLTPSETYLGLLTLVMFLVLIKMAVSH